MCDYSLMALAQRLARVGEELVTHRFSTGSLGLASPRELQMAATPGTKPPRRRFWCVIREFFNPPMVGPAPAVCVAPGARLMLSDISVRMQQQLSVGPTETVTFTQITASVNCYRDAVRFSNGREVRLQDLREGMRVKVLDLSCAEDLDLEVRRVERAENDLVR